MFMEDFDRKKTRTTLPFRTKYVRKSLILRRVNGCNRCASQNAKPSNMKKPLSVFEKCRIYEGLMGGFFCGKNT